ncbi:type I restriction-modification system subunit M N-terminal domain-containing protein, partial [Lacticaseibacillus paracasei]
MSEKTTQASQLESALWNAADVLRGKMDASEYKNYLLGLIFYRFLSEKTLTTFSDWAGETENVTQKYAQYMDPQFELEGVSVQPSLVEYLQNTLGYLIQPQALYATLIGKIQAHTFALDDLSQALHDLEQSTQNLSSAQDFSG